MTMDKWIKTHYGKGVDYDNVYGVQCVDLAKSFIKEVLGVEPQSIGNAIEYYRKAKTSKYLKDNFKWIDNTPTFVPKRGDLAVFESSTGHGHICVCTGVGSTSYFYSYDQNYPHAKHEPMSLIKHNYKNMKGVLRPLNQKNIDLALCEKFETNATIIVKTNMYSSNAFKSSYKIKVLKPFTRVRVIDTITSRSIVLVSVNDKRYRIGCVKSDYIVLDK